MTSKTSAKATAVFILMVFGAFIPASYGVSGYDPVEFLPPHSAVPVDSNSDSIYESVSVYAGVRVIDSGYYTFVARFFQVVGVWMANSTNYTFMTPGDYSVEIVVLGGDLYDDRLNGTYYVNLELYVGIPTGNLTFVAATAFAAGNFTYDEFAEPTGPIALPTGPIAFAPPHSGYPVDTDSDSLYEAFQVNVTVNVTEPGWYIVMGFLYTPETRLTSGVWTTDFSLHEVGVNVTVLTFPSTDIRNYGLDGAFMVDLELFTQDYAKISTMSWSLGNYSLSSFDYPPITHLEGSCTDKGLDINGDGLFEYLVVTISVHVMNAGFYGLNSWISAIMDNSTGPARVAFDLTAGIHSVDLLIRGDLFVNAGTDGPYFLSIGLFDGYFNQFFDATGYTTGAYSSSQFSRSAGARFEPDSTDKALDVNGDGAKEYLAVNVSLTVYTPGTYNVTGRLSVYVGHLEESSIRTYLEAGHRYVTLLFSGATIKASKWNSSYYVNLNLYDEYGNLLWSPTYRTNWYTWIDFASPPVAALVAEPLGDTGMNYTLNASVSYVEAVIYEVRWDFNSDGVWDTGWSAESSIPYEFPGPGNYTVTVEVRDIRGLTNSSSILVYVPPAKVRPLPGLNSDSFLLEYVLAVSVIAVVGTVALFMAWPVESLIVAFLALLFPLYTRLRKDDVLDNYKRGMIHGLILAHPGISFSGMREALAFSSGSLVYHLSVLQEKGQVCCRKSGTLMRYYLDGSPISRLVRLGLTDFQLEIVRHVVSSGEVSKKDIQIAMKSSKQTLHYNLKKLVTDGVLVSSFFGGHRMYSVKSGIEPDLSRALDVEDRAAYAQEEPNVLETEDSSRRTIEG